MHLCIASWIIPMVWSMIPCPWYMSMFMSMDQWTMDHGPWIKSTYFILIPRPAAWIHGLERFTIMNQVLEKPSQVYHVIMEPKDPRLPSSEFRSEPTEATERRSMYQPLIYSACTVRNRKHQPQYKAWSKIAT